MKKYLIKFSKYLPQIFLLFSVLVSNVFFPVVAIAEELDVPTESSIEANIPIDDSEDILDEGISTSIFEEGVYTVNEVVEGEVYVYPDNEDVSVKFTKVTEEGNLVIKMVELTDEEKSLLNTSDNYGWDISSSMSNGSFTYDLTLPNTHGDDIEVKYTEDGSTYESVDSNVEVLSDVVIIEGLDHFTVFVVTTPDPVNEDCSSSGLPFSVEDRCYNTLADAITNVNPGETIYVQSGTYQLNSAIYLNKNNVSVVGIGDPVIQVSGTGYRLQISGSGNTIDGIIFEKTDKTGVQNIIQITGNDTTISNNVFHGQFVIGDSDVSRALEVAGSLSGLIITDNILYDLRQPAYLNAGISGIISGNYTYRTKGWVVEEGDLTFTNNTWGTGSDANVYDIAIISGPSTYLTDIVTISNLNNEASIEDQRVSPAVLPIVYVDSTVVSSGDGTKRSPKKTIEDGLQRVVDNGKIVLLSDFTITQQINITKTITLSGNNHILFNNFVKTSGSNNSALGIYANGTTVENLTVDGTLGTDLHGITTYRATDLLFDNITLLNNPRTGLVINGSIATVNNITTSGNGWHGVNVDQGSGVTETTKLTVLGTSNHDEAAQIYIDDRTKDVEVIPNNQYYYLDGVKEPNDRVYLLDITAPSVPILESPIGGVYISDNTPLMQWENSTDNVGVKGYYYRVYYNCTDENDPLTCSSLYPNTTGVWRTNSEYQAGTTADGVYYWQVMAQDLAGNQSDWSGLEKVIIDTQAPDAPEIEFPLNNSYFNSTPILNDWTDVTDSSGIAYYRVEYVYDDGHSFPNMPYRTTTLSQRDHTPGTWEQGGVTVRVQAIDNAGNESNWSDPVHYIYDATKPTIPTNLLFKTTTGDILGCNVSTNNYTIVATWNMSVDNSPVTYEYRSYNPTTGWIWNAGNIGDSTKRQGSFTVGDGTYGFAVRAVDAAGNYSDWTSVDLAGSCQITYDSIGPVVTLTSPTDNYYTNQTTVHQTWTTTDTDVDHYEYRSCWNDPSVEVCNQIYSTTTTAQSRNVNNNNISFYWQVRGIDNVGNVGEWSAPRKITIDTIAPTVDITSHNNGDIIKGEQVIEGTVKDLNLSHYWFVITNSSGTKVEGPGTVHTSDNPALITLNWNTENVPDGTYTIKLEARDLANNKDSGSVEWVTVTVDNTAPVTLLNDDLTGTYINQPILIEGVSTDANMVSKVTLSYRETGDTNWIEIDQLDNTLNLAPFNWDYTWTPPVDGTYDIKASATDVVGNSENSPTIDAITYDTTVPNITILQIITGVLSVQAEDLLSGMNTIEFKIGNGPWQIYTNDIDLLDLVGEEPQTYTIYIRVTDKAGNVQTGEAQLVVTDNGEVQGATDENTTTPTYYINTNTGTGSGSEILDQTQSNEESETQVLGEETTSCETNVVIRGYLFLDKNSNDLMDTNEKGIAGVTIRTYYIDEDGNEITLDSFQTDENGYWESQLCPGDYEMEINQEDLPKNVVSSDVIDLQVAENLVEPMEFNIAAVDSRNFWQKYWYLILIAGGVIVTIGYVAIASRKRDIIQ